jgi:hypothetical protein
MDILNFISWIKAKRITATPPDGSLVAVGAPSRKRDDKYLTVAMTLNDAVAAGCQANSTYKTGILDDYPWIITPSMIKTCTRIEDTPAFPTAFAANLVGQKVGGSFDLVADNSIVEYIGTIQCLNGLDFILPWKTSGSVISNGLLPSALVSAFGCGALVTDDNSGARIPAEYMSIAVEQFSPTEADLYLVIDASTAGIDGADAEVSFEYEFLTVEGEEINFIIY